MLAQTIQIKYVGRGDITVQWDAGRHGQPEGVTVNMSSFRGSREEMGDWLQQQKIALAAMEDLEKGQHEDAMKLVAGWPNWTVDAMVPGEGWTRVIESNR